MIPDLLEALRAEVARFRSWAETYPVAERSGEWEVDYPNWQDLWPAFAAFVRGSSAREWDEDTQRLLLYVIARDNEIGEAVDAVAKEPDQLLLLAERALASDERYAASQLATQLGKLDALDALHAESLLLRFAQYHDEYVRRLALLALAERGSSHVEELAIAAWDSGHEYQRMAALEALNRVGSPLVAEYLTRAEADGRTYLAQCAATIRQSGSLRERNEESSQVNG